MTRRLVASLALASTIAAAPAMADTLENLERERARLIAVMHHGELDAATRQQRIEGLARRLRDLEQMALRDESLLGRNTPTVRQAFADYELTFLVHAAAERGVTLTEQWLSAIGLSTDQVMAARFGRR